MRRRQSGFSLVEVVVAMGVLALVALYVFALFTGGILAIRQATHRLTAASIAQGLIEDLRWKAYEDVESDGPHQISGYGVYTYSITVSRVKFHVPDWDPGQGEDHGQGNGNGDDGSHGNNGNGNEGDDDRGGPSYFVKQVEVSVSWGDGDNEKAVYTTYIADHSYKPGGGH